MPGAFGSSRAVTVAASVGESGQAMELDPAPVKYSSWNMTQRQGFQHYQAQLCW